MEHNLTIAKAVTTEDTEAVKNIFSAFIEFIPIDLGFQDIEAEMANFPNDFEFLLLAKLNTKPVGAVALKKHDDSICEMKRLYVLPEAQGTGAGRLLCEQLIQYAQQLGYKKMLLDSLTRLKPAVALYTKLGFSEVEPYNFNPEPDVIYMEKIL